MQSEFRLNKLQLLTLLILLFATTFAVAQGIAYGSLSGTVVDPQGAVVVGAKVSAQNVATGQVTAVESNDVGFFTVRSVPPGTYKVTIQAPGFRVVSVSSVQVSVARDTSLGTTKMELAQTGETVEVSESAPLIEATSSQISSTFSTQATADLPTGGGFDQLALFVPGVADSGNNSFSNNNGASFSSNGLRGRSNNFQIDGQSNNDNSVAGPSIFLANPDVIGEINIITDNFGVEYGHSSGSVVNYVLKGGTNAFHGSAFEYYTGSFADSHTNEEKSPVFGFCRPGQDPDADGCTPVAPVSRYVDNRFGFTVGGPIYRNKAWFFGSALWDRTRQAGSPSNSGASLTPTPDGLTALAAAFPGNRAVAALQAIGPFAVKAGNPVVLGDPTPMVVTDGVTLATIDFAEMSRNVPSLFNDREFTGKVDVQLTNKDRVSARYVFTQNILTGATGRFAAGAWVDIPSRSQQIALDWTRSFSSSFVNQLRFSYSRSPVPFEGGSFPNCTRATILDCPTGISLQGNNLTFGMQNNLPQGRLINNTQLQDNASLVRGRHLFKFGGEYYRQRSPNTFLPNINGTYTYSSAGSAAGGSCRSQFAGLGLPVFSGTICSFSRFLADTPSSLALTQGPTHFNFKEQDVSVYFGDDWRIKDNLTLNLGVRWEYATNAINLLHDLSVANQAGSSPFWDTTLPAAVTTVPAIPNHYKYFAPNVGFAWTPHFMGSGDKTVFRGGFRITYDPTFYNMFLNVASAAPVVNAGSISSARCTAPCLPTSGFHGSDVREAHLGDIPTGTGVNPGFRNNTRVANDFREPRTYSWSLGVQESLTSKVAFEIRYVGNHVDGNFQTRNGNPELALLANGDPENGVSAFPSLIPAGVTPCTTAGTPGTATGLFGEPTGRASCDFSNVRVRANSSFSDYNGLQTQFRVSNWHGASGGVSYTWSKTLDNVSEIFGTSGGGGTGVAGAQNPFDVSNAEKSLSGLDFPKAASVYVVYEFPFFKSQKGILGHLLGGYEATTTWRYTSGQVWTPLQDAGDNSSCQNSFDATYFGPSTCRPFVGNPTAPVDTVGECTDATLPDCGLVNHFQLFNDNVVPVTKNDVRWIWNNDVAATFFGTPYGNARRNPGPRGQNVSTVNLSMFKSVKFTERVSMRLEAQVYNLFNHQFLGVPDVSISDGNFRDNGSSFGNTLFNSNGQFYTNATLAGLARRRIILGAKLTF